jgi:MFS family permease
MSKRTAVCLSALYFLPWALQCFVNNLMPIFVASLDFATDKTVGEVAGIGAIVTALSQLVWSYATGRAKRKGLVLALSLLMLCAASLLFLHDNMTYLQLLLFTVLFYACYMAHQPIVDTITSETYTRTRHTFAFFRAFASLGYAVAGILIAILPNSDPKLYFVYIAVLAALSLVFALLHKDGESVVSEKKKKYTKLNFDFLKFSIFIFIQFFSSSILATFTGVFFTGKSHLGGDVGVFGILLGVASIAEWLLIIALSKWTARADARLIFLLIAACGVGRSIILALAPSPIVAAFTFLFYPLYFALLGATAAPYIKSIVPAESNAFAQGVFMVVSFGLGTFTGSYVGGIIADGLGMRNMFFVVTTLFAILIPLSFLLIKGKGKKAPPEET